jgi:hypothetical protein
MATAHWHLAEWHGIWDEEWSHFRILYNIDNIVSSTVLGCFVVAGLKVAASAHERHCSIHFNQTDVVLFNTILSRPLFSSPF